MEYPPLSSSVLKPNRANILERRGAVFSPGIRREWCILIKIFADRVLHPMAGSLRVFSAQVKLQYQHPRGGFDPFVRWIFAVSANRSTDSNTLHLPWLCVYYEPVPPALSLSERFCFSLFDVTCHGCRRSFDHLNILIQKGVQIFVRDFIFSRTLLRFIFLLILCTISCLKFSISLQPAERRLIGCRWIYNPLGKSLEAKDYVLIGYDTWLKSSSPQRMIT